MQYIIKSCLCILILIFSLAAFSQSTYLQRQDEFYHTLDRLEILAHKDSILNWSTIKPYHRQQIVRAVSKYYGGDTSLGAQSPDIHLSKVDQANLYSLLAANIEWYEGDKSIFNSKKSLWKTFYRTKANFYEVNQKDFFLAINPVIQQQQSFEKDNDERVFLNAKGVEFRGLIAKKIGFSAYVTDNQERPPMFAADRIDSFQAVPGVGRYKPFKTTAYDYFDARGSINFNVTKYIDFQFGYDKNFIGNGYRSMFLSDFGNSYLFLKINTRIWKINYFMLFMELTPQFQKGGPDVLLDKKYSAIHHLSINVTKWLSLGLFDAVVFGRVNDFDFTYLNPIIFLRVAEQQNGSADNAMVGFDFKANVAKRFQFYGQLMFDEFFLKELREGKGWWANKYGIQLGGKYINAFSIPNLDLQAEANWLRPFTYSHFDSVSNYTHYNHPMAHPFGANFRELIGTVRYQPHPRWAGSVRLIGWQQGLDSANSNFGGNIFKMNTTRSGDYGYEIPSGIPAKGINAQFLLSFKLKEGLYIDGSALIRRFRADGYPQYNSNTSMITAGIRWNMARREYDY